MGCERKRNMQNMIAVNSQKSLVKDKDEKNGLEEITVNREPLKVFNWGSMSLG